MEKSLKDIVKERLEKSKTGTFICLHEEWGEYPLPKFLDWIQETISIYGKEKAIIQFSLDNYCPELDKEVGPPGHLRFSILWPDSYLKEIKKLNDD